MIHVKRKRNLLFYLIGWKLLGTPDAYSLLTCKFPEEGKKISYIELIKWWIKN